MRTASRVFATVAAAALLSVTWLQQVPLLHAEAACVAVGDTALDGEEQAAVAAINAARAQAGVPALAVSATLTRAARTKSQQMGAGAPFAHDDPSRGWLQRVADCGYNAGAYVSENLAAGVPTAPEAVAMWMGSPAHRANMLAPEAQTIGIARARGGEWGWYWTANFGVAAGEPVAASQGAEE